MPILPEPMTLRRSLTVTSVCSAVGMALGTSIGWVLATVAPSFYSTTFAPAAERPGFEPLHFGIGLGLSQGALVGLGVGLVVTVLLTWQYVRATARGVR